MKLSITTKGLSAIIFIFMMQVLIFGSLLSLLQEAEREAAREARAKELVGRTSQFVRKFYDAGSTVKDYFQSRNSETTRKYENALASVRAEVSWIKSSMSKDKSSAKVINRIDERSARMLAMLSRAKRMADQESIAAVIPAIKEFRDELQPSFEALVKDVNELIASQEKIVEEGPKIQARARLTSKRILFGGIAANLLLALLLVLFFLKDIARRIHIMIDNTRRLGAGEPLNRPLDGSDEISTLDSVFHTMSEELEEAREAERESERRLRRIIEAMPIGLVVTDENGVIEFANPTCEPIFGIGSESLTGRALATLFENRSDSTEVGLLEEIRSFTEGKIGELKARNSNGEFIPVEVSTSSIFSSDPIAAEEVQPGQRLLIGILDITERYELNKLRQSFVSMVSHELRTPLTSVQNFLGMLNMGVFGDLGEKTLKLGSAAERSVERLIRLINDLLDLEKMEHGQLSMVIESTRTNDIASTAEESVRGFATSNKISLECCCDDVEIKADGDRVAQVLINLLSNAIKFSPEGEKVRLNIMDYGDEVEFRVEDRGRGIPENQLELVFERFQQVTPDDSKKKGGTGLGLSISKAIVEQHGGRIGVESSLGEGSVFWFRLPKSGPIDDLGEENSRKSNQ